MKRLALLLTLLALLPAACNIIEDDIITRTIVYYVDGQEHRTMFFTEQGWDELVESFCRYAEEGRPVTFYNEELVPRKGHAAKRRETFSTTDRERMKDWMKEKEKEGKTVTITYDKQTGRYKGTAYAAAPDPDAWRLRTYHYTGADSTLTLLTPDTLHHRLLVTHSRADGTLQALLPAGVVYFDSVADGAAVALPLAGEADGPWRSTVSLALGDMLTLRTQTTRAHQDAPLRLAPTDDVRAYLCATAKLDVVMHVVVSSHSDEPRRDWPDAQTAVQGDDGTPFRNGACRLQCESGDSERPLTLVYYDGTAVESLTIVGDPGADPEFTIRSATETYLFVRQ